VSNDNTISDALTRSTKYRLDFPHKGFRSLETARVWCAEFVQWYNEAHKHRVIKFVTLGRRHRDEDVQILTQREEVSRQVKPE